MAVNTSDLKGKLQAQEKPQASPSQTIAAYLEKMKPTFAQVLPKHMTIDRMTRIALTTIRTNPKLLECEVPSLMAAVMQAVQLGLEPGLLGHCYLLPFRNNKTGKTDVQFIIGYKGMIDLARRSGEIQSINAHEVYENDLLDIEYGLEEKLKHVPWHVRTDETFDKPGAFKGAYMIAKFKDGGHYVHYMPKQEIDAHRSRSKTSSNGPWVTDYVEMAKKTVVRAGWKWLPISIEVAEQVEHSDEVVKPDFSSEEIVIEATYNDVNQNVDPETGEINEKGELIK